ncbi:MAG: S1C family serine protease [Candidatus Coproplasma sp.]
MKIKLFACTLLTFAVSLMSFSGCLVKTRDVVSIEKTGSFGTADYFTITYTDGTTSTYTLTNEEEVDNEGGTDKEGEVAKITVEDLYEFYKQTDPDMTREEFIEKFLNLENVDSSRDDDTNSLSSLFRSGMKIYTAFQVNSMSTQESIYTGSGVLYKMEVDYSYILTNYHMIYNSNSVAEDKIFTKAYAYMYGSRYAPVTTDSGELVLASDDNFGLTCEYVGGSAECDVAIIKVSTAELVSKYPSAKAVEVNQSYEVGQTAYALGNPKGNGLSLTKGIISVDLEPVKLSVGGINRYHYLLRTDADLDHGSSGGGLFNDQGELIALCNAGEDDVVSINYAIPASTVVPCAEGILYYNSLDETDHNTYRMRLGVTVSELNCRYVYDSSTDSGSVKADVTVSQPEEGSPNPMEGSPAEEIGLLAGDIIKTININGTKHEINRMAYISDVLMQVRVGDSISITVQRDGVEVESTVYTVKQTDLVSM